MPKDAHFLPDACHTIVQVDFYTGSQGKCIVVEI